jgi:hypothetical protein
MDKHVPDESRCRKLRDLGIEFPGYNFHYVYDHEAMTWFIQYKPAKWMSELRPIPAPLVSEMLEVMPWGFGENGRFYGLELVKDSHKKYDAAYATPDGQAYDRFFGSDENPANALADLLCWLKENKHI